MRKPIVCEPDGGRNYLVWGDHYSFKTTGQDNGGSHALMEMTVNPGSGTPPHIHHAEDEMFLVLEGDLSLWCGDQYVEGKPGTYVAVPKGTVHRWANESAHPARAIVYVVPAGFEEFLMRIGKPVEHPAEKGSPPTPEEIEQALAIAGEYHMEIVG